MPLKLVIPALAAACLLAPQALAQTSPQPAPTALMPGVTYERTVEFTPRGAVALHVVRGPRPVGLYALRPILSREAILGPETITSMQKRTAAVATSVSVNGDYDRPSDGEPAGMLLRDGVLDHTPLSGRSSAGVDAQGTLHVDRVSFTATWRGTGQRRTLNAVNKATPKTGDVVLFTGPWARPTPRGADAVDAVLAPFPAATPDADLQGTVTQLVPGGGTPIPPGGAVLQVRGPTLSDKLNAEAPVGTAVTVRLILKPAWAGMTQAVGGGPVLVKGGKAIFRSNETFDASGLLTPAPRSAVGQLADGRVLLVTVDGEQPGYSVGLSNYELALALQRLGAAWAMALGTNADAAMAFDGTLLSRPRGGETPVAEALSLMYYGVYALPPTAAVFSPNGAGEGETLSYRLVRKSTVRATLTGPDGIERVLDEGDREPGTYRLTFTGADDLGAPLPEGAWRFAVSATDDAKAASTADRTFSYDRTLASLRVAPAVLRVTKRGGTLTATAQLTRPADLRLQIETPRGIVVATATAKARAAGPAGVVWDGRLTGGTVAPAARYVARVVAASTVGTSDLQAPFSVRRAAGK